MRRLGHGRAVFVGITAVSVGLIGVGVSGALLFAAVAVGVAQAGFVIYAASSLSLIQALSPPRLRGRLTSLFTLLYWGLMPFGALIGGIVAERTSALIEIALAGITISCCGAIAFIGRRQIATLRIAPDGRSVTGNLDGSGYPPEGRPAVG
jgi:MFS family permease